MLIGALVRLLAVVIATAPTVAGLIAAIVLNHKFGWEGKAFLCFLTGVVWSTAQVIAIVWIWDECKVQRWLNSLPEKKVVVEAGKGQPLF